MACIDLKGGKTSEQMYMCQICLRFILVLSIDVHPGESNIYLAFTFLRHNLTEKCIDLQFWEMRGVIFFFGKKKHK